MNEEDLNKIRNVADKHRLEPRPQAWDKLESMMINKRKSQKKVYLYRAISIAAVLIAVVSVVSVFSFYVDQRNPDLFTSNENFQPMVLEELPDGDDPFYSIENVVKLHKAYENLNK